MATIIFKPTTACNAMCAYCDGVREGKRSPVPMSMELLEVLFTRIHEFLLDRPQETMELVWHGGEPLLLGPKYFVEAKRFQEKHCAGTRDRIRHVIQTNLTLLRKEFLGPLRDLGILSFGSSYEMIPGIRGVGPARDSDDYNRKFLDAICMLEEEGFQWGVIYVVTKPALSRPLEIFHHLANLSPRGAFSFNAVLLYGHTLDHLRVTPKEYADFLGAIFPTWWRLREEMPQVHPFDTVVDGYLGKSSRMTCCDSGVCSRTHFSVLPDGSISHCGRSSDWDLLNYGSIVDRSLSDVMEDPQRKLLLERNTILPQGECKGCRFWDICHGGCPLDAWSAHGDFLHKSEWCPEKKVFLEKYVVPLLEREKDAKENCSKGNRNAKAEMEVQVSAGPAQAGVAQARRNGEAVAWIDPCGGLGDALMLSGVLKQVFDRDSTKRFHLVDRAKYRAILEGHPAIASISNPLPGAEFIRTDYWTHQDFRIKKGRAYQVLARLFGLETPAEELLYVGWKMQEDPLLMGAIPWNRYNVLISHSSVAPRKELPLTTWERLVAMLAEQDVLAVQATKLHDRYIRGAYNLLGLTTPRQLISMVGRFDAVITSDSFLMHAAHLCAVPAVAVWGPTDHRVYGYAEQVHLQAQPECEFPGGCLGPEHPDFYASDCPRGDAHCMKSLTAEAVFDAVMGVLKKDGAQKDAP